jgi:hypothetical protein
MSKKYIEENLEKLKKQRDEQVMGGYRDNVVKTYDFLAWKVSEANKDYCNPKNYEVSEAVFGTRGEETKVRGYIKDLKKSEYITVSNSGENRKIRIKKPINF